MTLRFRQQRKLVERTFDPVRQRFEQSLVTPEKTRHGGGVEEIAVVAEASVEAIGSLGDREGHHAHLLPTLHHRERRHLDAFEPGGGPRRILQHEEHLEERGVAEAPLRPQLGDQPLEGHLLVGVGAETGLAHTLQVFGESVARGQLTTQQEGIDEETDQIFQLATDPAGDGRADREIPLPRLTM